MLNHLGFLQYPIKEQCPFRTSCMEIALQKSLAAKQKRFVLHKTALSINLYKFMVLSIKHRFSAADCCQVVHAQHELKRGLFKLQS